MQNKNAPSGRACTKQCLLEWGRGVRAGPGQDPWNKRPRSWYALPYWLWSPIFQAAPWNKIQTQHPAHAQKNYYYYYYLATSREDVPMVATTARCKYHWHECRATGCNELASNSVVRHRLHLGNHHWSHKCVTSSAAIVDETQQIRGPTNLWLMIHKSCR